MAEKKATTKAAPVKKAATKKAAAPKKTTAKESALFINAESVGFRAGDVYRALATSGKTMSLTEIAKVAKITREEALLGIGWLLKEGKIEGENVADLRLA